MEPALKLDLTERELLVLAASLFEVWGINLPHHVREALYPDYTDAHLRASAAEYEASMLYDKLATALGQPDGLPIHAH